MSYIVITKSDELYHHGILGQKWGVRRYQNSNGSLTEEGKKRYGILKEKVSRGKQYSREQQSIKAKKQEKLKEDSFEYKRLSGEQDWIRFKYSLDENGKGGDTYWHDEEKLASARQSYQSLQESKEYLESQFSKEAYDYANKIIAKKYGETALSDIHAYELTTAAAVLTTLLAASLGAVSIHALLNKISDS